MDLATSSTSQWIRLRSRQLRAQLALAIYTLLPVRIMTSTLVAVYFASCSIEARTSTYGFLLCGILLGATLFIQILKVFIHYQLVQFISSLLAVLWTFYCVQEMYDATHHFPLAHCSQYIFFFLLSTSLFPLDPQLCAPQARALEMWRGVVKGGWSPP